MARILLESNVITAAPSGLEYPRHLYLVFEPDDSSIPRRTWAVIEGGAE
jgi:hypothetical protein